MPLNEKRISMRYVLFVIRLTIVFSLIHSDRDSRITSMKKNTVTLKRELSDLQNDAKLLRVTYDQVCSKRLEAFIRPIKVMFVNLAGYLAYIFHVGQ